MPDPEEMPPEEPAEPATDAADPEEPQKVGGEATSTGRSRLKDALAHPRRTQAVAAVLLAVVGFAAVIQVRTTVDDKTYEGYQEQELIDALSGLSGASRRAQDQLDSLNQTKQKLESSTTQRRAAVEQARKESQNLQVLAGKVPVKGPGVQITITQKGSDVAPSDFLELIEELRTNGAEAIEVNGTVRVVGQSYISAGDDGLVVDGHQLESPYVVRAIGEPAGLQTAVTFYGGPGTQLEEGGAADVDVKQETSMEIRSVRD